LVGKTEIDVVSTVTTLNIQSGAAILEPSWRQTSRINQLANEIVLKVTESRVNDLIAQNTAGLLPAENFTFGIDEQGFTGSNATFAVVVGEIYAEYKVTNATNPHIAKTTGISYVADDNPAVNIRIKRDAGSSWNASFAWTTDGTNFFSQAFVEPPNVGTSFQIATMDLTSNVNYTGTITGVKLFLGDTIDDTFFLESFTIGKFNPQANILNDLSQSVVTNEANITINANAINSYVTGTQGLNKIANVTGTTYSIGTPYDRADLANIVAGASVKNGQILILQNADGTFQQVVSDRNQNPLESPLRFNFISFSENILAGAVLFEPSYAATSRITQQAGTLVLKAEVVEGEITKLAFISLDSTSLPDESVLQLQANQIRVDGQTTFFNNLKTLGVASRTGVNTTIRSDTAPTTRNDDPIAPTALVAGDTWIKTNSGNLPHTYDGRSPFSIDGWIRDYTQIDGGVITTGTINAQNVAIQSSIPAAGVSPDVRIDGSGVTIRQIDAGSDTSLSRSIHWINSTNANTELNQARLVSYASEVNRNVAIDASGINDTRAFRFTVRRNINGNQDLSIGIAGTTNDFVTGAAQGDAVVSVSDGILWLNDTVRVTSSLTANSLIVGTGTNKATISYTTNTARTFTIPNTGANADFVMTAGTQTIAGFKTFTNTLSVSDDIFNLTGSSPILNAENGLSIRTGFGIERIKIGSGTGEISFFGLPTSLSGLASGRIWNDSGVLRIVI
jgi:hypothetical protein